MENNQNSVYVKRQFKCSPSTLYKWMVKPELIAQWFGPKQFKTGKVSTDLKIGGDYSIQLCQTNGNCFFIEGQYINIIKSKKLVFSFAYRDKQPSPPPSTITINIEALDSNTSQLTLIQTFETLPNDLPTRTVTWEAMLLKLETCLFSQH